MKDNKKGTQSKPILDSYNYKNIKTTKHIIGYVDILGVKEILKKGNDNFVNELNKLYILVCNENKEIEKAFKKLNVNLPHIEIKMFSDNIIFAIKYNDRNWHYDLGYMLAFLKSFQIYTLINNGLLMRGGVCIGELYIDDIFVCGKGLIDAYSLETDVSVYPRILVDRNIICQINDIELMKRVREDFDGQYFVDYLIDIDIEEFKKIKDIIRKKTTEAEDKPKVLSKIGWLEKYVESIINTTTLYEQEKVADANISVHKKDTDTNIL